MTPAVFDHFDAAAGDYARRSGGWLWGPLRRREARAVLAVLGPQPGERILDAGCGAGHYARLIAQCGAAVRGLDGSQAMVDAARREGVDADLFDLAAGPPPGAPYDRILCAGALEFCADPALVVANLTAGLRGPGAPLVIFLPSTSPLARLYRRHHARHGLSIRLFSREALERLIPPGTCLTAVRRVAFSWIARIEAGAA